MALKEVFSYFDGFGSTKIRPINKCQNKLHKTTFLIKFFQNRALIYIYNIFNVSSEYSNVIFFREKPTRS